MRVVAGLSLGEHEPHPYAERGTPQMGRLFGIYLAFSYSGLLVTVHHVRKRCALGSGIAHGPLRSTRSAPPLRLTRRSASLAAPPPNATAHRCARQLTRRPRAQAPSPARPANALSRPPTPPPHPPRAASVHAREPRARKGPARPANALSRSPPLPPHPPRRASY